MNSLEESVGGNDRDCPCEMSFPYIYVCARMLVKRMRVCVRACVCVYVCVYESEKYRRRNKNRCKGGEKRNMHMYGWINGDGWDTRGLWAPVLILKHTGICT